MLAVLCPGQGAQSPGFLAPWLTSYDVRPRLEELSTAAGFDLVQAGTDVDFDVVDTAVAQPLLVATAIVTAELLGELPADLVVVGHSVGELSAAAIAGMLSATDAVALAARRGAAMKAACADAGGGMTALLGGSHDDVLAAIERSGCVAANVNGAGQVVAAGRRDALDRLAADAPAGSRLRPLAVAGPFHSPWMAPAADDLGRAFQTVEVAAPRHDLVSNLDGAIVTSAAVLAERIVAQLTAPVRFDLCLQTLRELGVTAVVELAPGGVLAGIARRELPGVDLVALRGGADVAAAAELIAREPAGGEQLYTDWRVVVAPARGTFHPAATHPSTTEHIDLTDGRIGVVTNRAGDIAVTTDNPAVVVEWLAADGDPVSPGQPLARVHA